MELSKINTNVWIKKEHALKSLIEVYQILSINFGADKISYSTFKNIQASLDKARMDIEITISLD